MKSIKFYLQIHKETKFTFAAVKVLMNPLKVAVINHVVDSDPRGQCRRLEVSGYFFCFLS